MNPGSVLIKEFHVNCLTFISDNIQWMDYRTCDERQTTLLHGDVYHSGMCSSAITDTLRVV